MASDAFIHAGFNVMGGQHPMGEK